MIDADRAIDTDRLTMRVPGLADFAESAAMWGDPEVVRYIGGRPFTEEEIWARILRYVGHWELLGFGYWTVRVKGTGQYVGEVGWANFRRAMEPSFGDTPEAGWVTSPAMHGNGYATEAARAAMAWGDRRLQGTRRVCIIDPRNAPSIRVAEKCGFREVGKAAYKDHETIVFERG